LVVGLTPPAGVPNAPPPAVPAPGVHTQPAPGTAANPAALLQRQPAEASVLAFATAAQHPDELPAVGLLAVELTVTVGMSAFALSTLRTRTSPISRSPRS
jgi:hypothetical protein